MILLDEVSAELPITPDFDCWQITVVLTSACTEADGRLIRLGWSDASESRLHAIWLRDHATDPARAGAAILEDDALLETWCRTLHTYGIALLTGVGDQPGTVERIAQRIGPVRETNFGRLFDVRVQHGPGSNAYTSGALTPHTDLPTREYQPGLQFLHCLKNTVTGGEVLFVDGFFVADCLRKADPVNYERLCRIAWPSSNRALNTDYRWRSPVIVTDASGCVTELRVVPFLRAPLDIEFDEVEEAYGSLRAFFTLIHHPDMQLRLQYKSGDLVAFDNRRVLHGRTAYDPTAGERWLQGCYGEREELLPQLRILNRRYRQSLSANL